MNLENRREARFYRPELDALRFFAFLCVFFFHRVDYLPIDRTQHPLLWGMSEAGAFGVPVFFLLSSFLIVELLLRERAATGSVHIKSFYARRILRIWPLYFAACYGLIILGRFLPNVGPKDPRAWLAFTFFAGNWYILRHGWIASAFDPLWSIAIEEQFYITVPWLARFGGRRAIAAISLVLLVISYVTSVKYAHYIYAGEESGQWVNSWFQFQFFAAGALLALALHGKVPRWPMWARLGTFLLAACCWIYAVMGFSVRSYDVHVGVAASLSGWTLVLLGSVLFFLAALGTPPRYIPNWLTYLGRISYGLYIFHSLMFYLVLTWGLQHTAGMLAMLDLPAASLSPVGTVLVLALTIAAAAGSYHFFERPFLRLKQRFTFVRSRPE